MRRRLLLALGPLWVLLFAGCNAARSPDAAPAVKVQTAAMDTGKTARTFEQEVAFLQRSGAVIVLAEEGGGRIAVSPKYQGRVMTSAIAPDGVSLGWINHAFIDAGRTGTAFDNFGGEDRFWLGPEAGQYGLFFPEGKGFTFAQWHTPPALNEGDWTVREQGDRRVVLTRSMKLTNYSGVPFELEVERTISLLGSEESASRVGLPLNGSLQYVAFETVNRITNTGQAWWRKEKGLLSIWILGMYAPLPDAKIVIPFDRSATGEIMNDRYFGKVPNDRLGVHEADGYLVFVGDGRYRSKIGVGPARAMPALGSFSASAKLLTLVQYNKPARATDYVNSMWELQNAPYQGDVVNSYNDGPTEPGKPSLGGFYEIETSSPAAALGPGASMTHVHRTLHFVGERAELDAIARKVLGVGLDGMTL